MKYTLSLFIIFNLFSCAAWRTQDTQVVKNLKKEIQKSPTQPRKVKAYLSVDKLTHYLNGELVSEKTSGNDKIQNIIKEAYDDAGFFEFVSKEQSEIEIKIEITNRGKSDMAMTVLTAVTLFLFPSKTTDEFSVKATFYEKGEKLGILERKETVQMYRQLFLIFAMPFKSPFNINNETLVDLNRSIILEAHDDGFFAKQEN